jgi:ferredoxin
MGTAAIVVTPMIAKTLVQMIAEKQISLPSFIPIAVDDGTVIELTTNSVLEDYVTNHPVELPPQVKDIMDKLEAMSVDERFQYWRDELTRCFKCYACRAACPLCYCDRCITDCNQPQWINYSPHTQGNYEWHINRAMHLAGRCIECGACGRACPLDIPIHLLTIKASHIAINEFDYIPGIKCDTPSALSSFKVEDQENFIK